HPIARIAMKILNVKSANEFGEVLAAVGLAQNLAALRALSSEGIQRGHMSLHSRNIAITAGATSDQIKVVADRMVEERKVNVNRAKEILEELKK
ncbi:MAG: 3-hydroxy-3-methylglutaryl-CoA reductase, partial [Crenarchaeota archaeon]|nr:3-hydroxy-3-methylglutaryl-CoA reductase [Thermoproteota archaeon]